MQGALSAVEAYLAALPDDQRVALESLRATIAAAAPGATEAIGYGMPTFRHEGRGLVGYAAFKAHCSLFPMSTKVIAGLADELAAFVAGKGTLRFTPADPIPSALVQKIVAARLEELSARPARR